MSTYQRNVNQTVTPSNPMEVVLPEQRAVTLNGSPSVVGVITRYTTSGSFVESKSIATGPSIYGPFTGTSILSLSCTAGSIAVSVAEAVVASAQLLYDANSNVAGINAGGKTYALTQRTLSRPPDVTDHAARGFTLNSIWQALGKIWQPVAAPDSTSAAWGELPVPGGCFTDIVGSANTIFAGGFVAMKAGYTGAAVDVSVTIATVPTTFTINILASGEIDAVALQSAIAQADAGTDVTCIKLYDQSGAGNHYVKSASYPAPYVSFDDALGRYCLATNGPYAGAPRTLKAPVGVITTGSLTSGYGVIGNAYSTLTIGRGVSSASNGLPALYALGDNTNATVPDRRFCSAIAGINGKFNVWRGFAKCAHVPDQFVDSQPSVVVTVSATANTYLSVNESIGIATTTNDTAVYTSGWLFTYDPSANDQVGSHRMVAFAVANVALSTAQQARLRQASYARFDIRPQALDQIILCGDSRTSSAQPTNKRFNSLSLQLASRLGKVARVIGMGNGGYTNAQILANQIPTIVSMYNPNVKNTVFYLASVNDGSAGATPAQMMASMQISIAPLKAVGFRVVLINELSTTSTTNSVNTKLPILRDMVNAAGPAGMGCDAILDPLVFSPLATPANTAFYSDGLHPTEACDALLASAMVPYCA